MSTLVPLTFSEICPKWDKLLDKIEQTITAKIDKQILKDLGDWSKCVVGEAYHGNSAYSDASVDKTNDWKIIYGSKHCHQCYRFSVMFHTEGSDREKYDKQFAPMKAEFAEHWNKEHSNT